MSRVLHVAKVWQIEYRYPGLYGCDGQDVFYNILEMFDVRNSAEDIYTDDFEIERSELQRLQRHISGGMTLSGSMPKPSTPSWRKSGWIRTGSSPYWTT